jgi:tetratricopeptide (TPR) repeat protein
MKKRIQIHDNRRRLIGGIALVVLAAGIAHGPGLQNGVTNWDDPAYLSENPNVLDLSWKGLGNIFHPSSAARYSHYIPLVILSYALEFHLFGTSPLTYHATNIILHILNALLLLWLVYQLSGNLAAGVIAGVLFAVHPTGVESVAWIAERKNVLSGLFFLGSLIAYAFYVRAPQRGPMLWLAFAFCFLSLLAKAGAVVIPFLYFLIDDLHKRPLNRKTVVEKIPALILSLVFALLVFFAHHADGILQAGLGDFAPASAFSFLERMLIASHSLLVYILRFIIPSDLSAYYPFVGKDSGWLPIAYFFSPLILLLAGYGVSRLNVMRREAAFGLLFFVITVAPTLQIIPAGVSETADRYAYLAYGGLCYIVGLIAVRVFKDYLSRRTILAAPVVVLGVIVIGLFTYMSRMHTAVWNDSVSLWNHVLERSPGFVLAYVQRGNAFLKQEDPRAALVDFTKALELDQRNPVAYNNRGIAYQRINEQDEAVSDFNRAIEVKPDYADAYNNRGYLFYVMEENERAIADFTRAITLNPSHIIALKNRGRTYADSGLPEKALEDFDAALAIAPDFAEAYEYRARIYVRLGLPEKAREDLQSMERLSRPIPSALAADVRKALGSGVR